LPSQKQVRWSQLRVGLTVIFASLALAVLIFLMSGTTGIFTRKMYIRAYFDNAGGLRVGAPVRLHGVDIGNVTRIRIVGDRPLTPVEVGMKIGTRYAFDVRKASQVSLSTAGVLGETFVDIDSTQAQKSPPAQNGDELPIRDHPDIQDVVRASQGTLQNIQTLVQRLDRIVSTIENGQGSVGKFINDPGLYNRLNQTLSQVQVMVGDISSGKGSVGKLIYSDELYQKLNSAVDKMNQIVDDINGGKGTVGVLLKDEEMAHRLKSTVAEAHTLVADINAGKGALGKLAKDEELARKLDTTLDRISKIADRLEAGEGSAGKLLKDPSLYNNADQMLMETRQLVKAIRENPKKYLTIHFRVF
jgi:phospholipid/cholesterol/gamma-HCH transport system substrate-binding protein